MKNITGSPVEHQDFFDRPRELRQLLRELGDGNNLRLNAPRRVGKTSLVLRLCEVWREQGPSERKALYQNVEDCTDEVTLIEKMLSGLSEQKLHPEPISRALTALRRVRKELGGAKLGVGIDLELGDASEPEQGTLAKVMESVLRKVETGDQDLLIVIDELPEVLLALQKETDGAQRVSHLLHWLRSLRQMYRHRVRWVFLGSIGLEGFVEERNLGKTINDLTPVSLDALTEEEADAFLHRLGGDNGIPLGADVRAAIIKRLGWALPHHLQIVVHALRGLDRTPVGLDVLDQAFDELLSPQHLSQFDTWRQRLHEQFDAPDAAMATAILSHLCQYSQGRRRAQVLDAIMARSPSADALQTEERLARLLQLLQRDGYLLHRPSEMADHSTYAFRSFLLRDFWFRRFIS